MAKFEEFLETEGIVSSTEAYKVFLSYKTATTDDEKSEYFSRIVALATQKLTTHPNPATKQDLTEKDKVQCDGVIDATTQQSKKLSIGEEPGGLTPLSLHLVQDQIPRDVAAVLQDSEEQRAALLILEGFTLHGNDIEKSRSMDVLIGIHHVPCLTNIAICSKDKKIAEKACMALIAHGDREICSVATDENTMQSIKALVTESRAYKEIVKQQAEAMRSARSVDD